MWPICPRGKDLPSLGLSCSRLNPAASSQGTLAGHGPQPRSPPAHPATGGAGAAAARLEMRATWTVTFLRSLVQLQRKRRAMPSGLATVQRMLSRIHRNP
ncbi:RIKEN cDNA 1700001C19, isoform CRA_a [Mus musculus]|nr:RIKEN cDNA 1700001C19, isoform CRA_a [Mus musculus]|eukprot:XP_017173195.1 PREDICTED: uncharacterized protein LOC75462 isoform X3 [Mus musculus]